eukprot:1036491-Prymnesium_polylepis.3
MSDPPKCEIRTRPELDCEFTGGGLVGRRSQEAAGGGWVWCDVARRRRVHPPLRYSVAGSVHLERVGERPGALDADVSPCGTERGRGRARRRMGGRCRRRGVACRGRESRRAARLRVGCQVWVGAWAAKCGLGRMGVECSVRRGAAARPAEEQLFEGGVGLERISERPALAPSTPILLTAAGRGGEGRGMSAARGGGAGGVRRHESHRLACGWRTLEFQHFECGVIGTEHVGKRPRRRSEGRLWWRVDANK